MKTTMYELLGMVKDGKAPKKVKYDITIWKFDGNVYRNEKGYILEEYCDLFTSLNDEVEILEEKKILEKLNQTLNRNDIGDDYYRYIMENRFTINEIIDCINSKGE